MTTLLPFGVVIRIIGGDAATWLAAVEAPVTGVERW
jgi:hypothetical protein